MDELDRRILDFIQRRFPIKPRPFLEISKQFDISEQEAFQRIRKLKKNGIIRRIGAIIDTEVLGAERALVACKVDAGAVKKLLELVNCYEEVTHNYLRSGSCFNLWFTVVAKSKRRFARVISEIKKAVGSNNLLVLKAMRTFKIGAVFDSNMIGNENEKAK